MRNDLLCPLCGGKCQPLKYVYACKKCGWFFHPPIGLEMSEQSDKEFARRPVLMQVEPDNGVGT